MAKRRLSRQQQRRIASNQQNKCLPDTVAKNKTGSNQADTINVRIISHHGKQIIAETDNQQQIKCKIRQHLGNITCGDYVAVEQTLDTENKPCYIAVALQPRYNLLEKTGFAGIKKPVAANIDQVIIVYTPLPQANTYLIDRYLVATENLPAKALLVINKTDLFDRDSRQTIIQIKKLYEDIGYPVITTSVKNHEGIDELNMALKNKTSILVGLSGVGKSSLVKTLLPEQNIRIGETSTATGEGKHTTTVSALYHLHNKGIIIDSPGVRDFTPVNKSIQSITRGFVEIQQYSGQCRFSNCNHSNEPGCIIKKKIQENSISSQRFNSYQQMKKEL